jgi:ribosome biogenesis protein ENP2
MILEAILNCYCLSTHFIANLMEFPPTFYLQWITDRKRRALAKENVDIRRRIELIQDFEMPRVSTGVGLYLYWNVQTQTPRSVSTVEFRLHVNNNEKMSTFDIVCIAVGVPAGRPVRRIPLAVRSLVPPADPQFGRDLAYHSPSCDLFLGGASSQVTFLSLCPVQIRPIN